MRPSHLQVDSQRGFIRIVLHIFARADSVCRPRPESGQSQPTLDAIRNLAKALSVSADMLLFEKDERGPDEDVKASVRSRFQAGPRGEENHPLDDRSSSQACGPKMVGREERLKRETRGCP